MEQPIVPGLDAPDAGEALIGFGLATAVRDAAIALVIMLGLLYLFPVLGLDISALWTGCQLPDAAP
jgi:hypothetical protein